MTSKGGPGSVSQFSPGHGGRSSAGDSPSSGRAASLLDLSGILRDVSMNSGVWLPGESRHTSPQVDLSLNSTKSSLGILPPEALASLSLADITNSFTFPPPRHGNKAHLKTGGQSHLTENRENIPPNCNDRKELQCSEVESGALEEEETEEEQQLQIQLPPEDIKLLDDMYSPSGTDTEGEQQRQQQEEEEEEASSEDYARPLHYTKSPFDSFVKPLPPDSGPTPRTMARPRPTISTPPQGLSALLLPSLESATSTPALPPRMPVRRGPQIEALLANGSGASLAASPFASFNGSGFPWEQIIANSGVPAEQEAPQKPEDLSAMLEGNADLSLDPSFCTGKISARSTSMGPKGSLVDCTRDENFSDFTKPASFQGSYASLYSDPAQEESIMQSGFPPVLEAMDWSSQQLVFNPFDPTDQLGQLPVGQPHVDLGFDDKRNPEDFLNQEEQEFEKANPFLQEQEPTEEPLNASVFSGVSDKSILLLRNSGLWGGDTSGVDLEKLRVESKLSRCQYFRHNSSRLGSLEDSIPDWERPAFGFVHKIRSPEHVPHPMLDITEGGEQSAAGSGGSSNRNTYIISGPATPADNNQLAAVAAHENQRTSGESGSSGSGASSANTTYIPSGESTKTVVSQLDQSATLKAEELAGRLQALASQLGSPGGPVVRCLESEEEGLQAPNTEAHQPNVDLSAVEQSIHEDGTINLSTISRALSEASLSSDPQHFVNMILSCLKKRAVLQEQQESGNTQAALVALGSESPCGKEPVYRPEADHSAGNSEAESRNHHRTGAGKSCKETPQTAVLSKVARFSHKAQQVPSPSAAREITPQDTVTNKKECRVQWAASGGPLLPDRQMPSLHQSNSVSEPVTPCDTPTPPPLAKSTSVPCSLDTSSKRRGRRPSGARHSSPVKKPPQLPQKQPDKTYSRMREKCGAALEHLLEKAAHTPDMFVTTNKLVHTSTPYPHPNLNLSTVILDSFMQNKSVISPLAAAELSISPAILELSNVSPSLQSTMKVPVVRHVTPRGHLTEEIQLAMGQSSSTSLSVVELVPSCELSETFCSHVWHTVQIPLKRPNVRGNNNSVAARSACLRLRQVWVGSVEVPAAHWPEVLKAKEETQMYISYNTASVEFTFMARGEGAFALSLALVYDSGAASSSFLRFRVEEPSLALLTANGESVDFGTVANHCLASSNLLIVNSSAADLPLSLNIASSTDIFSFAEDHAEKHQEFLIPGKESGARPDEAVAKEIRLWVNTRALPEFKDPRVFVAQLEVRLTSRADSVSLGTVRICVRVCMARLVIKEQQPLVLSCAPGAKCHQTVALSVVSAMPLTIQVSIADSAAAKELTFDKSLHIMPGTVKNFDMEFRPLTSCSNFSRIQHELRFQILPGGPVQSLTVFTQAVAGKGFFASHKGPGLKLGRLADQALTEPQPDPSPSTRFPVESDRSALNWFAVPVGKEEIQSVQLRNSCDSSIVLNLLIRDAPCFRLVTPAGHQAVSCQITFAPKETREVSLAFRPQNGEPARAKLVLKPQSVGQPGGKCFKACISLLGLGGASQVQILDAEQQVEEGHVLHLAHEPPVTRQLRLLNIGSRPAFVRLACVDQHLVTASAGQQGANCGISMDVDSFLLGPNEVRTVQLSFRAVHHSPPTLVVFSGPELVRRVLRRINQLPGSVGNVLNTGSALLGFDFTKPWAGEEAFPKEDPYTDNLVPEDADHFLKKTEKWTINIQFPPKATSFAQLTVEETLSESRLQLSTTIAPLTPSLAHSPPTTDAQKTSGGSLELVPRHLILEQGGESIVKMINNGPTGLHWDLSWPASHLSVSPQAGQLAKGGQAIILISALNTGNSSPALPPNTTWHGQVEVFSENTMEYITVAVRPSLLSCRLAVSPGLLDLGLAVVGASKSGCLTLSNPGAELVQWRASVEPSFFSLPQASGLLNPGQAITLPVCFRPGAAGPCKAALQFTSCPLKGGKEVVSRGDTTSMQLCGAGIFLTEAASRLPRPPEVVGVQPRPALHSAGDQLPTAIGEEGRKGKAGGLLTMDSEVIFPVTTVGKSEVEKIKIKNRTSEDQVVRILPLPASAPFHILHTEVEVKTQGFSRVPIQFRPLAPGIYTATLQVVAATGRILKSTLTAKAT